MVQTLLTGATGRLGQALRPRLLDAGHQVRAASRSPPENEQSETELPADAVPESERLDDKPLDGDSVDVDWVQMDLREGTGIENAVTDVDVVIHAATAPQGKTEAVDVDGTNRLLKAAKDAGVSNFCYVSIVGVDQIPYSYYEHKLAAEQAIESSDVPETILRATQFHSFLDDMLGMVSKLPIWPLPTQLQFQPIEVGEVADAVVEHATPDSGGRVPVVGGPEVRTLGELASAYRKANGLRRPTVRVPIPGAVASGFRAGDATCPNRAVGTVPWEEWLEHTYGTDTKQTTSSSPSPS